MAKTHRINVVLPDQTHRVAKFLADKQGTTVSEVVRTALGDYVRDELLKEREVSKKCDELGIPA